MTHPMLEKAARDIRPEFAIAIVLKAYARRTGAPEGAHVGWWFCNQLDRVCDSGASLTITGEGE